MAWDLVHSDAGPGGDKVIQRFAGQLAQVVTVIPAILVSGLPGVITCAQLAQPAGCQDLLIAHPGSLQAHRPGLVTVPWTLDPVSV